jgi:protein phosphatase methylesterase 1
VPPKVREVKGEDGKVHLEWKVDLMKSEKHWMSWFKGLTASFLGIHMPKLLMLAEKDRMDKELTIA